MTNHPSIPGGDNCLEALLARLACLPVAAAVDAARTDQESRWRRGEEVPAERYLEALPQVAASPNDALVIVFGEVLLHDVHRQTADLAAFQTRFPRYRAGLASLFELHSVVSASPTVSEGSGSSSGPCQAVAWPGIPGYQGAVEVGRGGMGVVYRACDLRSGRVVAIKTVHPESQTRPDHLVRFCLEGELMRKLRHPNIVQLLDTGVHAHHLYMVMEWVEGGTLAKRVARRPQDPAWAVTIMVGVASAVAEAHAQGIVHRDLKPGNVMLTAADVPKVTDFGVARLLTCGGTVTATGDILGTPSFMPPEQIEGRQEEICPASDVYALGALLYHLLTGRPPFVGKMILDILPQVVSSDPTPPRQLAAGVSAQLDAICLRCLRKRPHDRYVDAGGLADALRRLQSDM
jgi:hypothetical protein